MAKEIGTYDLETGEILGNLKVYDGEDEQKERTAIENKKSKDEFKRFVDENLGNFYFLFYKLIKKGIEKQYIIRFLYLCTYMDYNNKLLFGNTKDKNKYMVEKDLQEVLKLSKTESSYTKKILIENSLILVDNNILKINKKYCLKGTIDGGKKKSNKVRIFENGIKELYEKAKPREHKKLALLIEILPYINLKYNIICENAICEKIEDMKPLNIKILCKIVGYSPNQSSRLKKDLLSLKINGELVVMFNETNLAKFITVNPRIYYKGTRKEDVEWLLNAFKIKQ